MREEEKKTLLRDILTHAVAHERIEVTFPGLEEKLPDLFELACFQLLSRIKDIIGDPALSDRECFEKMEEIVCAFEDAGTGGGGRHDFG